MYDFSFERFIHVGLYFFIVVRTDDFLDGASDDFLTLEPEHHFILEIYKNIPFIDIYIGYSHRHIIDEKFQAVFIVFCTFQLLLQLRIIALSGGFQA